MTAAAPDLGALVKDACDQSDDAYELALELESLLDALCEPDNAPKWVFPIHRMAKRICQSADLAHTAAIRLRSVVPGADHAG